MNIESEQEQDGVKNKRNTYFRSVITPLHMQKACEGKGLGWIWEEGYGSSREINQCLRLRGRKEQAILAELEDQKCEAVIDNSIKMGHGLGSYDTWFFFWDKNFIFHPMLKGDPLLRFKLVMIQLTWFIILVHCEKREGEMWDRETS